MVEQQKTPKFGLLKCPFALQEEVIRNMEFMDAFHFSTLSKRSKQMVHKAKYQTMFIAFRFEEDSRDDHIEMEIKDGENLKISLSDSNYSSETDQKPLDGRKLASLIDGTSGDYRKKISAHLLFIFHSKCTNVYIDRNIEELGEIFQWDFKKTFDYVRLSAVGVLYITPEALKSILNSLESKKFLLDFKMDDSTYKYRETLNCEILDVRDSIQWLEIDNFLERNPKMKILALQDLPGEQINNLLKQWINGKVVDMETWYLLKDDGYPDDVIFDGIVTMKTMLTEKQAFTIFVFWDAASTTVDIRRKVDGKLATVHINWTGCVVSMCNEQILAGL
ncbi:hypothetical protein B9Z55_015558 [Caenorhabditis nigoni]|uniref:F-box domain-containing protein n=1 Tax=Caenorhabditis nigoni TaxID=1611254 RepID=A0A2G5UB04_9PELO|nr:hypothetical protein B9Z55_015558 [Caenorhabditis nigoni]